jgi:hypothetical protein
LTVKDEASLRALPFPPGVKVIGSWIDEEMKGRDTIYRDSHDRLYSEVLRPDGTREEDTEELIELPSSAGRRFEGKGPASDETVNYYFIEEEEDFQIHLKGGTVWKARAIR